MKFFLILLTIEFLRFLYTREIQLNDDLAKKFIELADKYVQNDLSEKCVDYFNSNMSSENVYEILDFAWERGVEKLKNSCYNFVKKNIDVNNVSSLIQYLEKLSDEDCTEDDLEAKANGVSFILNKFGKVYEKNEKNWKVCEDFLIKNIEMKTFSLFVNFVYWKYSEIIQKNKMFYCGLQVMKESEESIRQGTESLKGALFAFAQRNFPEIREKKIILELPNQFLADLFESITENKKVEQ